MGGVIDGGVGIDIKTSPRRAAIERAQSELRQEYGVREERRRELEFLEKGGNPLDFKFGNAASVSVQSTSICNHQTEHFVTSEAKGSFALAASPHGDSVENSGRLGATTICEPNSADNFDAENEILESERNTKHPSRSYMAPSEQYSPMDGTQNAKESEDSAVVRSYARRNRSKPNRDGARSCSTDVAQSSGGHGSSFQVHEGSRDTKGPIPEINHHNEIVPSGLHPEGTTLNGDLVSQTEITNVQSNMVLDGGQAMEATASPPKSSLPENRLDFTDANILRDDQPDKYIISKSDDQKTTIDVPSGDGNHVDVNEQVTSNASEFLPGAAAPKVENSTQLNGFSDPKRDGNEGQNSNGFIGAKGVDSESSCTQSSLNLDASNESDVYTNERNDGANGIVMKETVESKSLQNPEAGETGNDKKEIKVANRDDAMKEDDTPLPRKQSVNDSVPKIEEELQGNCDEVKCSNLEVVEQNEHTASEADKKLCNALGNDVSSNRESNCCDGPLSSLDLLSKDLPESCSGSHGIAAEKAYEDSILEEARSIEDKRKRIIKLPVGILPLESHQKSHWDFVLEEMTWLANDFAQERLWKMTAAAQICHQIAFSSRLKVEEHNQHQKLKKVAFTLAKAVTQFWHLAEMFVNKDGQYDSKSSDGNGLSQDKFVEFDKTTCYDVETQNPGKNLACLMKGYAARFLKCNASAVPSLQAEAPATPDRMVDSGAGTSWEDHLTEESLFYAVPSGAMETYRISIESHLEQCEKTGSSIQEEVDTSMYDGTADFEYRHNAYDEEDGETNTYYLHRGFEDTKTMKREQKKRKSLKHSADFPCRQFSNWSQQNVLIGKRPSSSLIMGPIPTKRVRTTPRPRFTSPFTAGASGYLQTPAKTDASSGDTSSFQDEQSTLHGGSQFQKSVEVESALEQLQYDCADTSTKPKKKKKAKYLVPAYETWQLDASFHNEQRENSKKGLETHNFDSNGTSGLFGQHTAKKPKLMKQPLDGIYDNMAQMSGSHPSPVASQMSNIPGKVVKLIVGRDRGRKTKALRVPAGQPAGAGSPWSLFEDQALVVLVHDMGPNWELVSDVINNSLQFKCIFRKPKECKERHKILMDKSGGDGYDSADDSRTSQSYPSTLPGIPKGSARQLFQRLQGPMEEDTIKSHFEKIIMIGQKYHCRSQDDNQDPKTIVAVHFSHVTALNEVPSNKNGGILTPLDLCDTTAASPDVDPHGYQSTHASTFAMGNQGAVGSILPAAGPLNAPMRDGRYSVTRTALPVEEQQRTQQYNQILSNRNLQQSNLPASGSLPGADRGVRMLPGGNPVGMMPGMNRSMPSPRPGFQGMASSSMMNSGSMLSSGMAGMSCPLSMQSGSGSGQANSMMRSREGLQMMRAGHNSEHQRQIMVPELQIQVTQANSQVVPAFNGLTSAFANQTTPALQAYPGHPQPQHQLPPQQSHVMGNPHLQGTNHPAASQQQAYAMRVAKHRFLQQQQQHFAASSAMMSHVQSQSQLPVSSSMQSNSQVQPQTSSQPASVPSLSPSSPIAPTSVPQQHQKHTLTHHGISRSSHNVAPGMTNQMGKQRPRQLQQHQQFQQSSQIHPPQRQHSPSPQQAKLVKGMGRGNMVVHQNLSFSHSPSNGLPGNQNAEEGEHVMNLMQGQGLYSGSGLSSTPSSKPLVNPQSSSHSQPQQKIFSAAAPMSSKQLHKMPSHTDHCIQGQLPSVPSCHSLSTAQQSLPAAKMASTHQHLQPQQQAYQRQPGQVQPPVQRMLQQKSQTDQGHKEQHPPSNVPQMGTNTTTSVAQACSDPVNVEPVVSSSVASQWKPSETLCDSAMMNSSFQMGSIGSPPLTSSNGSEPLSSVNKDFGQKQLSGGLPQHGSSGAKWQQQPPPPQSATIRPQPVSQQLFRPQEQQAKQEQQSLQQPPPQEHS